MKKQFLKTFCLLLFANLVVAQKSKFYVSLNAGYNLPAAASTENENKTRIAVLSPFSTTQTANSLQIGKGINAGINFGYQFNEFIAAELGINYLKGTETSFVSVDNSLLNSYTLHRTFSATALQVMPKLVLSANFETINPYAKFGLVIGSVTLTKYDFGKNNVITQEEEYKYNGGLAIGFNAGAGVNYKIKNNTSFFVELNFIDLNYGPTKLTKTKNIFNGVDVLNSQSINDRETEYLDEYIDDSSVPTDPNLPQKENKKYFALGSLGVNVGVRYGF